MLVFPVLCFFSVCLVSTTGDPVFFLSISIIISLECQSHSVTAFLHCNYIPVLSLSNFLTYVLTEWSSSLSFIHPLFI